MRRKNSISPADISKIDLSIFNEDDPWDHIKKVSIGFGIYIGFRGKKDHEKIFLDDIQTGVFEEGHPYAGYKYACVVKSQNFQEKVRKLSMHNAYVRDMEDISRIPIVDDDPKSDCWASSLLRLKAKASEGK